MTTLQVFERDGQQVIDSRDVAEMVDREHSDLLKTIRVYGEYLGLGEISQSEFFIESSYQNAQNRPMPCYLITKKGCDMIANKMTGKKGVLFTAAYVDAFEKMRTQLQQPMTPAQLIAAQAQVMVQMEQRINSMEATLADVGNKTEQAMSKLDTAIQVYAAPRADHWQDDMNSAIQTLVRENGWANAFFRAKLYDELERTAGKNLKSRLTRLKQRMRKSGMTYKASQKLTKLDAVAADKELRLLFETIVKKYQAQACVTQHTA